MQRKKKEATYQPWNYKNKPLTEEEEKLFPQQYEGFVYLLTHEPTQKKYIGKKSFISQTKRPDGKRGKIRKESNWKSYFSSSDDLKSLLTKENKKEWRRDILFLCEKMKYANYLEVKLQFHYSVLEDSSYLNSNINGLWFSSWLKDIYEEVHEYKKDER